MLSYLYHRIVPKFSSDEEETRETLFRYRRLWQYSVLLVSLLSLVPLVVMTVVNYRQYRQLFADELSIPTSRETSNVKRSLESFIAARLSALELIVNDRSFDELVNPEVIGLTFSSLKKSFGGFVDLGLIDSNGDQRAYVGPYELEGRNYKDQDWFHEVQLRNIHVSDVFMGYRRFPHFVIAVKHEESEDAKKGGFHVLRATIDTEILDKQIGTMELPQFSDAFIINHDGVLQTSSRYYGDILEESHFRVPPYSSKTEVTEEQDAEGRHVIKGYAYIQGSPFIVMVVKPTDLLMKGWLTLRKKLVWFLAVSAIAIVIVILWGTTYMVERIHDADAERLRVFRKVQYTNKMASIGRLAAGVAHEINNPLAIINEKAGLLIDVTSVSEDFPQKEKIVGCVASIIKSVERCSTITHRLLGFGKRMDVKTETIELGLLIREVLTFLGKESSYRNITLTFDIPDNLPCIESDRGQLQQVFLNIINNAFDAVIDGGQIDIIMREVDGDRVKLTVSDNGEGISEENLKHIFDPFFSTKKEYGTGLGLSITYGIVDKLGGKISVQSEVGVGTSFFVVLPLQRK
jgi:two-component system, NtrC family, sensor kinase